MDYLPLKADMCPGIQGNSNPSCLQGYALFLEVSFPPRRETFCAPPIPRFLQNGARQGPRHGGMCVLYDAVIFLVRHHDDNKAGEAHVLKLLVSKPKSQLRKVCRGSKEI